MSFNRGTSKTHIKCKSLSVSDKPIVIVSGIPNIPRLKVARELGIPLRKVTDKRLGSPDTGEIVLRLLQITEIQNFQSFIFRGFPA